ncbi:MAG: hypothetical protein WAQ74_00555 [Kiritimatiellia bacterium]|jgi:hypothetical protein|nr:hypothetical protein [Bacteroidota bacterium]HOH29848.1 hypothetical protein [Candidatus Hydrogenedentota bacterium]
MKKLFVFRTLLTMMSVLACTRVVSVAADLDDIPGIRSMVLTNASSLAMPAAGVVSNFTVVSTQTNGTLLQITAQDVCGTGTQGVFSYSLDDTTNVIRVVCRDDEDTGTDYWFFPAGTVRFYSEYHAGNMDGIYMKFHTNTEVSIFMNVSNNSFIGKCYEFATDGSISQVTTTSVPRSVLYYVNPPQ